MALGSRLVGVLAALVVLLGPPALPADETTDAPELAPIAAAQDAQPGSVIHLEYTLWSAGGELLDSSQGRSPLVFTLGKGEVIAGLDRALVGMKVGERKRVTVPPEDAYGAVDPAAVTEVPKARVPPDARVVGARVPAETRSGRAVAVTVREVREDTVILDLNHPLAGQTLVFEVRIILVEPQ